MTLQHACISRVDLSYAAAEQAEGRVLRPPPTATCHARPPCVWVNGDWMNGQTERCAFAPVERLHVADMRSENGTVGLDATTVAAAAKPPDNA